MIEHAPTVLIIGGEVGQTVYANTFADPAVVGNGPMPNITLYNPHSEAIRTDLAHMNTGLANGYIHLTTELPRQDFDIAVIATPPGTHARATEAVLNNQNQMPLLLFDNPIAASPGELEWFRTVEPQLQSHTIVNESFLMMEGVQHLVTEIDKEKDKNPLREIRAWSSGTGVRPEGELGAYGAELPDLHAAASFLTGKIFGLPLNQLERNTYMPNVNGVPGHDALRIAFITNDILVCVSQGLGQFVMQSDGRMEPYFSGLPPKTRRIELRFADNLRIALDANTAFPEDASYGTGFTRLRYFENEELLKVKRIPRDEPRRKIAGYALRRAQNPSLPTPPLLDLHASLQRSEAILTLQAAAYTKDNVHIVS